MLNKNVIAKLVNKETGVVNNLEKLCFLFNFNIENIMEFVAEAD